MTAPNTALRAWRMGARLSQDDLARLMRDNGAPSASKKLIQRWEAGQTANPRPALARALELVARLPLSSLGFTINVPGQDLDGGAVTIVTGATPKPAPAPAPRSSYTGIWLSRYEYYSSGRDATLEGKHYVVVLQHEDRLSVQSIPGGSLNPDSPLTMDLSVDGNVVTGTWVEQTAAGGYYRGARYHGTVQMLAEPTGRRMTGKWLGFGAEMDINTGPWELVFQEASTAPGVIARYARVPE